ncbi:hypothetical protein GCM10011382_33070 [Vreelandella lutescens]|uniref:Uncharacterized protein n=1 Tax=Vreelandella lutescens TaxID=1602943 RepID=A0ABQ1PMS5_9GAMM|nr:hypothetical protein GCM10011382_33070 [Halomonas lutescens]
MIIHGGLIQAAPAAPAGASFARCSRSFVTPRYVAGTPLEWFTALKGGHP